MNKLWVLLWCTLCLTLTACGSGGDSHHHNDDVVIVHYPPELHSFQLVDSYGFNSDDDPNVIPALSPFVDGGLFEVYWDVHAMDDYTVELRINDRPSFVNSRLVSNDYCGAGLSCDLEGALWCEYNKDFSLTCDPPEVENPGVYRTYVDDWIFELPQRLYFLLEVCDTVTTSCEFQIVDALFE